MYKCIIIQCIIIQCGTIEIDMINTVSGFFVFFKLAHKTSIDAVGIMLCYCMLVPLTCISIKMVYFSCENRLLFM